MINNKSSKNKHILFLVSSMQGGGAERVAALLCNHWANNGYTVTLMPTFSGKGNCSYPLEGAVHLDYLADHIPTNTHKTLWSMLRRLWTLRKIIKESQADVVVSFLTHVNIAAILATRGLPIPIIASERTHPPSMPLSIIWRLGRKITYRWATHVIAQTQETANWLQINCPKAKIRVIPNPVVFPLAKAHPILNPQDYFKKEQHLIIAVGRLDKYKNFDLLIDAFSTLNHKHPHWNLVIFGKGNEQQNLEVQRDKLGLTKKIHLLGHAGNLGDWYQYADLYVMSSQFEGFPNTLLEAMSYGLASISLDCDVGPRDIIQTEKNGILVPLKENKTELTMALERLIENKNLRLQMGKEASKVRERFSMEKVAGLWGETLDQLD